MRQFVWTVVGNEVVDAWFDPETQIWIPVGVGSGGGVRTTGGDGVGMGTDVEEKK